MRSHGKALSLPPNCVLHRSYEHQLPVVMNDNNKEKDIKLCFPESIMQLMEEFFSTSFADDIDKLQQEMKHPAHKMNERMKLLTNADEQCLPVGIDIPVLIKTEKAEPKATVVLLGQDPLRQCKDIDRDKVFDYAFIGTPYRIHHTEGLPSATKVYPKLIRALLEQGYNVYLTDVKKYYPSPSDKAAKAQDPANADLLVRELQCLKDTLFLVLSGAQAHRFYVDNEKRLKDVVTSGHVIRVPHLSNWGPTHESKIENVMNQINAMQL